MPAASDAPISDDEAAALFADLSKAPALILAVSGGPDSTALLWLAARWRDGLKHPPQLIAVTIDHGLRKESASEAREVAKLAKRLNVAHRTLRWTGLKPKTGIQEAARHARYRLLGEAARKAKALHVLTAHTLDDQAETVLFRLARGSGVAGLRGMAREAPLPSFRRTPQRRVHNPDPGTGHSGRSGMTERTIVRPLITLPKSRLLATLAAANLSFSDDPSNRDPRFTRPRLRELMPQLAAEGLDASRLAMLARRVRRADTAIERAVDEANSRLATRAGQSIALALGYGELPAEIGLRLLGRLIDQTGTERPVELAKLESLHEALMLAYQEQPARFRRTLAGALVTLSNSKVIVETAPPRRNGAKRGFRTQKARSPSPARMT